MQVENFVLFLHRIVERQRVTYRAGRRLVSSFELKYSVVFSQSFFSSGMFSWQPVKNAALKDKRPLTLKDKSIFVVFIMTYCFR